MTTQRIPLPRVEGHLALTRTDDGPWRLATPAPRDFEALLRGRAPLDAVYLTQHISADTGLSHALAAMGALEHSAQLAVTGNGRVLRELMHGLSVVHAHVRHLYQRALPDYVPLGAFAAYSGALPGARRLARGLSAEAEGAWSRAGFDHPFNEAQVAQLAESYHRAAETLVRLQRMLALLGGKFPMAMTLVPGGTTTPVTEPLILRLRDLLDEVRPFLEQTVPADARLLARTYAPLIGSLGRSGDNFISAGSLGDLVGPDQALFPPGVVLDGKLVPLQDRATESVQRAFYRVPDEPVQAGARVVPAPEADGAYSWIKAPRYDDRSMETGAAARLIVVYLGGSRTDFAAGLERIEDALGVAMPRSNTVAGRLLAWGEEVLLWSGRLTRSVEHLLPGEPSVPPGPVALPREGRGTFAVESPAGTVQHHVVIEDGRIGFYDIVGASTWNGAPEDAAGRPGPIETALNTAAPNLADAPGQREAARLVHSFAFSSTDAVH